MVPFLIKLIKTLIADDYFIYSTYALFQEQGTLIIIKLLTELNTKKFFFFPQTINYASNYFTPLISINFVPRMGYTNNYMYMYVPLWTP